MYLLVIFKYLCGINISKEYKDDADKETIQGECICKGE